MAPQTRPDLARRAAIHAQAARQHWLVTHPQLVDAGYSREAIRHLVRSGRIHRVYRGVYSVGRTDITLHGRWHAAVLACGEGAALSHLCGAALWGIREESAPTRPQVSVPTRAGRTGPRGIEIHRPRTLESGTYNDIPVTSLVQTLLDVGGYSDGRRLKAYLRQSERLHKLDVPSFATRVRALPPSLPRRTRWLRVLKLYVPDDGLTANELEAAFFELCAKYGIPRPALQRPLGTRRLDFVWDDVKLIAETDGRGSHDTHVAFVDDRRRDRELRAAGYDVIHFAYSEVMFEPERVAADILAARARLARA